MNSTPCPVIFFSFIPIPFSFPENITCFKVSLPEHLQTNRSLKKWSLIPSPLLLPYSKIQKAISPSPIINICLHRAINTSFLCTMPYNFLHSSTSWNSRACPVLMKSPSLSSDASLAQFFRDFSISQNLTAKRSSALCKIDSSSSTEHQPSPRFNCNRNCAHFNNEDCFESLVVLPTSFSWAEYIWVRSSTNYFSELATSCRLVGLRLLFSITCK